MSAEHKRIANLLASDGDVVVTGEGFEVGTGRTYVYYSVLSEGSSYFAEITQLCPDCDSTWRACVCAETARAVRGAARS